MDGRPMRHRDQTSNYQRLARRVFAEHTRGAGLDEWLLERRAAGTSWRRIGAELHYLTDGEVSPAVQTLVDWHAAAQLRSEVAA